MNTSFFSVEGIETDSEPSGEVEVFRACCAQCKKPGPAAKNENYAFALAIAEGFRVRLHQHHKEAAFLGIADLNCSANQLLCPACYIREFQL